MSEAADITPARLSVGSQEYTAKTRQRALKRKFSTFVAALRTAETSYPSPPMSGPPSPSRTHPELPQSTNRAAIHTSVSSHETVPNPPAELPSIVPFATNPPPATSATEHRLAPSAALSSSAYHFQPLQTASRPVQPGGQALLPAWTERPVRESAPVTAAPTLPTSQSIDAPSRRGGRKAKTHVASACINCKRAHLSCDDTCFDVQHKKRGRPRLREEGEFKVGQISPEQMHQVTVEAGPSQTPSRPIAGVRHRRGESFRSLLSQTSDESPTWSATTQSHPLSSLLQSPFSYQYPAPPHGGRHRPYELATALLDLDFVVLRANQPFEQIVMSGESLRGRHISDVVGPADGETFDSIRLGLRAEREAREPAHMPPILQPGQDPLQGVSESDIDRFTESFSDRTYTWTLLQLGSAAQTFPARVRLAKAGTYFVAVTLPSFRPVDPPPMQLPTTGYGAPIVAGPSLPFTDTYTPSRQSELPTAYPPVFPAAATPILRPPPPAQQYPAPPYQPQQPLPTPQTPRLPIAEPPTETTAFTPRSLPREPTRLTTGTSELQLPPIGDPATAAEPARSRATTMDSIIQHGSSDDGETEESPRKRRRLGIDDVLHR